MKKTTLLALAVVGAFSLVGSINANAELSPRGQELANSLKQVPGTSINEPNLATGQSTGNAKAAELAQSLRKVNSTGNDIDLANAPRPAFAPRDPRYEMALRENATKSFQVAPLK